MVAGKSRPASGFENPKYSRNENCFCIYLKDIYHDDMKEVKAKKRPNQSMFAMLGLLSIRPMTGYELRKLSEESIQHFWRESFGQIYPSLRALEVQGMVTRTEEMGEVRGRPARQVYALTDGGREALRTWVAVPARPEVPRNELLLKLFFGRQVPAEVNLRQIAERRRICVEELEGYKAIEKRIRAAYQGCPDLPFWLLTLNYGKQYTEAEIAWCDEAQEILKGLALAETGAETGN
jgi:PadR family transcriptional regulator, regulatory protein AphA